MDLVGQALGVSGHTIHALAAVAVAAGIVAVAAVWRFRKSGPPRFDEPPYLSDGTSGPFLDSVPQNNTTGRFGELLTALYMVGQGWRQLPSQPSAPQGLDGIFIRRLSRGNGWEVCLAETKASKVNNGLQDYKGKKDSWMTDDEAACSVEALRAVRHSDRPYIPEHVATAILRRLKQRSRFISKKLFVHSLRDDVPESPRCLKIYALGRNGEVDELNPIIVRGPEYRNLLDVLEIGLARFVKLVPPEQMLDTSIVAMQGKAEPRRH